MTLRLEELINAQSIALDVQASDWKEAIRRSGELLVADGAAGNSYTEAMIRVVEEHGPYIVIAPGFALAHARPDASVRRTALSFIRLAQPVAFGAKNNDPVGLVMALASQDSSRHQQALASLAKILSNPTRRQALDQATSPQEVLQVLCTEEEDTAHQKPATAPATKTTTATTAPAGTAAAEDPDAVASKGLVLTVCGNGVGTSLFLKNTTEQVLDHWGWGPYLAVEATDTISAKGRAQDADMILTSGAIAQTLGDLGVAVEVISDFTSTAEIDAALRRRYLIPAS